MKQAGIAKIGFLSSFLILFCGSSPAADIPALVRQAKPAVVQLLVYDQDDEVVATATGFFISPDGKLLTNFHVIAAGQTIIAKSDAGRYRLQKVLVSDEERDVALLRFDIGEANHVPYLKLGSSLSASEGQEVLVIGNPETLVGTVSTGIISAFREQRSIIQITAPISEGSSGSPVINTESGEVIGVAEGISEEGQNLNFAISAEAVKIAIANSGSPPEKEPSNKELSEEELAQEALRRAREKFKNKDYQGALMMLNLFLVVHPNNAAVLSEHALVCFHLGNPDQAISDCNEAIRLKPDDVVAYLSRGGLYYKLERYADAIKDITEAIRLRPNNATLYRDRAQVYDAAGDHARARADRKKAKELALK